MYKSDAAKVSASFELDGTYVRLNVPYFYAYRQFPMEKAHQFVTDDGGGEALADRICSN